jgi:hypothetical protein
VAERPAESVKSAGKPVAFPQEQLWADLASTDEAKAARALLTLAGGDPKQTVSFLRERLRPVKADPRRVSQLIAQLDNEAFDKREAAQQELAYLGKYVKADLQKAVQSKGSVELVQRAQRLLKQLEETPTPAAAPVLPNGAAVSVSNVNGVTEITVNGKPLDLTPRVIVKRGPLPTWQRAMRAAAVLEHIGTPEARKVLELLAAGESDALPTRAAKEALKRLTK